MRTKKIVIGFAAVLFIGIGIVIAGNITSDVEKDYLCLLDGYRFSNAEMANCEAAFAENNLKNYEWVDTKLMVEAAEKDKYAAAIYISNSIRKYSDNSKICRGEITLGSCNRDDYNKNNATEKELAELIGKFDGVEKARVLINRRRCCHSEDCEKRNAVSASATVWPTEKEYLSHELLTSITKVLRGYLEIENLDDISILNGKLSQVAKGSIIKTETDEQTADEKSKPLPLAKIAAELTELIESLPEVDKVNLVLKKTATDESFDKFTCAASLTVWPENKYYMNDELFAKITAIIKDRVEINKMDDIAIFHAYLFQKSNGKE